MRIFSYARVSTESQTTENQKLELKNFVEKSLNGSFLEKYYFSENISGKVPASERPEFQKLLNKLDDDDVLVVAKIDRLGRSTKDVLNTIDIITKEKKCKLFVVQLGVTDLSSPAGSLLITMLSAVAQMERDLIVERTKSGLARAKLNGKVGGKPSLEKILNKKGYSINDVMAALATKKTIKEVAKQFGICEASIYRLKKFQNEKYQNEINKYFDIQRIKVPGGVEIIQNVSFKNDEAKVQWFNFETENNKKIILNSITDKDLKSRILILLGSENFDLVKSK